MIRLLLFGIFAFLIYTIVVTLLRILRSGRRPGPSMPPEKSSSGEDMVKDPVCGTYVPKHDAIRQQHPGGAHYFCSSACAERFRKGQQ